VLAIMVLGWQGPLYPGPCAEKFGQHWVVNRMPGSTCAAPSA